MEGEEERDTVSASERAGSARVVSDMASRMERKRGLEVADTKSHWWKKERLKLKSKGCPFHLLLRFRKVKELGIA